MDKKILMPIALMVLVLGSVLVSALMTDSISENKGNYNVEIPIQKGWNLILSSPLLGQDWSVISSESDIKKSDIKAIFYYFRVGNKYLQVFPEREEIDGYLRNAREKEDEIKYFMQAPVWVYSERSGTLKYSKTDMPGLGYIPLTGGWNFVTISPEMNGKTFGEIRGTCNFEKIAFWDKSTQSWIVEKNRFTLRENENPESWNSYLFADSFNLGQGILLKVSSDCQLGTSGSSVTPPTIPN